MVSQNPIRSSHDHVSRLVPALFDAIDETVVEVDLCELCGEVLRGASDGLCRLVG